MVYEHRSDCWYKDVCQVKSCESCLRFTEMEYLMQTSCIPKARQIPTTLTPSDKDYDAFCYLADLKDRIVEFVDNGENLYICSHNTGNGKTSWAIKLMLKYFDSIWAGNGLKERGLFIHVPTLLLKMKDFDNELSKNVDLNLIPEVDLIIWDDIAQSEVSKYDYNNLLMFIDNRIFNQKSNIFTSNVVGINSLSQLLGDKLASRIVNTSHLVVFEGRDKRNGIIANN